jgi:hypothetical protein
MQKVFNFNSTITFPTCGFSKEEKMPEDSCQFFYECENCKIFLNLLKAIVVFSVFMVVSHAQQFKQMKISVNSLRVNHLFSCYFLLFKHVGNL